MENKYLRSSWLNELYKITDRFICLLLRLVLYSFMILIVVLFCIYLVSFIYKDTLINVIKPIPIWESLKCILIFTLKYLLTPFVTIGTAYLIMKQWQINNIMKMREHIIEVIQKYRDSIIKLVDQFEKLEEDKSDKEYEKKLKQIQNDKEYNIDRYLTELEALSLYLHYKTVDEQICKEFFLDTIIDIFRDDKFSDVLEYIDNEKKRSPKYFQYLIKIYNRWNQEESNEFSKSFKP